MQKLKNKLHSTRGESLVEVLIAMLIVALATMLLAAMVNAAGEINTTTRMRDKHFYAELSAAETLQALDATYGDVRKDDGTTAYQVTVTAEEPTGVTPGSIEIPVKIYGGDHLTSYRKQP